jgi:hypothetical protein
MAARAHRAKPISRKFAPHDMAAQRIVLDASVAVEWFLPDGGRDDDMLKTYSNE